VKRFFLVFFLPLIFLHIIAQTTAAQTTQQSASPFERLEYTCANDVSLTLILALPRQLTLIFKDAFYPMYQVGEAVRFEDAKLVWTEQDGVGRLEQKDGTPLAETCVTKPPSVAYICSENVTLDISYLNDIATIIVRDPVYGEQRYELPKVEVASGAKFSNGLTTWLVSGAEGNLFEETEEVQHAQKCKLQH
jgi:membrane-bound inhibitor of C-type lysozyme